MSSAGFPGDGLSPDSMEDVLESFAMPSTDLGPQVETTPRRRSRSGPFLFGMLLIGLGGAAALAAQTAMTLAQSGSILLLVCAVLALGFLIFRASRN